MKFFVCLSLMASLLNGCTDGNNADDEGLDIPNLTEWLDDNPTVKAAITLESANVGPAYVGNGTLVEVSYDEWSDADKAALGQAFNRVWANQFNNRHQNNLGEQEFSMPMACTICASEAA